MVCRSHGIGTARDEAAWVALRRSPPLYPDAVTLRESATAGEVLRRLDGSAGCSVKDSFAALDLAPDGFEVLFEAEWIHRPPLVEWLAPELVWSEVGTPGELRDWAAVHGGGAVFHPSLLADQRLTILAGRAGDELVAGAIGNRSTDVVGISNVFTTSPDIEQVWAEAAAAVSARLAGIPLVGYERDAELRAARRAGFASVGALRVWLAG